MSNVKAYCNPLAIENIPSGRWLDTSLTGRIRLIEGLSLDFRPSVIYHEGKWIMYPSYAVAYIRGFCSLEACRYRYTHLRYNPAVVSFRKMVPERTRMSEIYVAMILRTFYAMRSSDGYQRESHGRGGRRYLADGDRLYFIGTEAVKQRR